MKKKENSSRNKKSRKDKNIMEARLVELCFRLNLKIEVVN